MDYDDAPMFSRSRTFERAALEREAELRRREIEAAERAALWSKWSMVVAALALALAAWPYVRPWLAILLLQFTDWGLSV